MTTEGARGEDLRGRVAIVTGGGRGLGRAMVLALLGAGVRVLTCAARAADELARLVREAQADEDCLHTELADVTRLADGERLVGEALARWGRLDILVNNAGRGMRYVNERFLSAPAPFWEANPAAWRMVIDTNVNGPFYLARAAVRPMLAARWGRIINVSMNHATMRRAGFSPYGPSKAALESETIIWAQDLQGTGVTVNALLPGGASATGMIPAEFLERHRERLLAPEVMAPALLWLASPASDGVSGRRVVASRWNGADPAAAIEEAGWV